MKQESKEFTFLTNNVEFATHLTHDLDTFIHSHSFYEIFYITEGTIRHVQNGQHSLLQIGDMLLLRPNDIHTFERIGECTHRDITISKQLFEKVANFINPELLDDINKGIYPIRMKIDSEQIKYLENQLNFIKYMSPAVEKYRPYLINSFIAHILGYLYISDQDGRAHV